MASENIPIGVAAQSVSITALTTGLSSTAVSESTMGCRKSQTAFNASPIHPRSMETSLMNFLSGGNFSHSQLTAPPKSELSQPRLNTSHRSIAAPTMAPIVRTTGFTASAHRTPERVPAPRAA